MKRLFPILFLLALFGIQSLSIQAQSREDYDLKWSKFKSREFAFSCKMPLDHILNTNETEFGKELQISNEQEYLSFYISALKHNKDLSGLDVEELGITSVYSFLNAMEGELVYMRAHQHSGAIGYESRIKIESGMQARYAVYFKGQIQYQIVEVFLSDSSEAYFHQLMRSIKFK